MEQSRGKALKTKTQTDLSHIPDWHVVEQDGIQRLERVFKFKDFVQALDFTNKVGEIAEKADHHPLLITEYGRVTVQWWTHTEGGIAKNDVELAARTDALFS